MRAGIMGTLHGKGSAPNAGERGHAQVEPQDKTPGNMASNLHLWGPKRLRYLLWVWRKIFAFRFRWNVCILPPFVERPVMVLPSPSPSLRRRKMLKKVVESILLGGSSGVPHLLPKKNQVRHFYMIKFKTLLCRVYKVSPAGLWGGLYLS